MKSSIELLIEHEELIAELYRRYKAMFAGHEAFFQEIVEDEVKHAMILRALSGKLDTGEVRARNNGFPAGGINMAIEFVQQKISETEMNPVPLKKALTDMRNIEKGMLEHRFFEIFESDDTRYGQALASLREDTDRHARAVEEFLERIS